MTRLDWGTVGERVYETGVDRGVLYIGTNPGVAWSGLTAVRESTSGADVKPYYQDGIKYANRITPEEYEATIEAYTYPPEFGVCDGTQALANGLFARHQRRKPFGFSYRTRVGNDTMGLDYGYKIHIVYDALAEPSDRENTTIGASIEPFNFSWHVTTKPAVLDFAPTAHFVINSNETPQGLLGYIEDILYGNELNTPRLPSAGELAFIFTSFQNPVFDAGDPNDVYYYTFDGGAPITNQNDEIDGGDPSANTVAEPVSTYNAGLPGSTQTVTADGGAP